LICFNILTVQADIFDYFKKDLSKVPTKEKLKEQEPIASNKLNTALQLEQQGRKKKAIVTHRNIVKNYPFTTSAAKSQFYIGEYYMSISKDKKAFDAFQNFIDKYKSSASYMEAISNQYKIAVRVLSNKKQKKLSLMPDKVRDSDLLKWFLSIIDNAPFSKYAPLAQFAIAESYQNEKKASLAILSYQKLVDKYPNHKLSSEAQYRIGDIARKKINSGSRDSANITYAKNAMEDVIVAYENSPRAKEAADALKQLDSIQGTQLYETGLFYEKQKQLRSAVIYYEKAIKSKNPRITELAKVRIKKINPQLESDTPSPLSSPESKSTEINQKEKKIDTKSTSNKKGPLILPPSPKGA
jgi:outer membrane assembly lipoprotein YfiO